MRAAVVSIGDELLIGQVTNTNAAWIGQFLSGLGVTPVRVASVGDDVTEIVTEIRHSFDAADAVVLTGGLGPTHDDVTRDAVARYLGTELLLDEPWVRLMRRRFARRGLTLPERNRVQALIPIGMELLRNPVGTAPGLWKTWREGDRTLALAVLPGVPFEMEELMRSEVARRLQPMARDRIRSITLQTAGIGESHLQQLLAPVITDLPETVKVAYLPSLYGVRVRISETRPRTVSDPGEVDRVVDRMRALAPEYVYGTDDDTLESVVGAMLKASGLSVATAESCTGGAVCDRLTDVPGASSYVLGGIVAYCNSVKTDLLGVSTDVIERDGAVSAEAARQMAVGVARLTGANLGVSVTGILGPTGGTPEKPVGTVWIACSGRAVDEVKLLRLGRDRVKNKQRATTAALNLLRLQIMELTGARQTS